MPVPVALNDLVDGARGDGGHFDPLIGRREVTQAAGDLLDLVKIGVSNLAMERTFKITISLGVSERHKPYTAG